MYTETSTAVAAVPWSEEEENSLQPKVTSVEMELVFAQKLYSTCRCWIQTIFLYIYPYKWNLTFNLPQHDYLLLLHHSVVHPTVWQTGLPEIKLSALCFDSHLLITIFSFCTFVVFPYPFCEITCTLKGCMLLFFSILFPLFFHLKTYNTIALCIDSVIGCIIV